MPLRRLELPASLLPSDEALRSAYDEADALPKAGGRREYRLRDLSVVADLAAALSDRPLRFASLMLASPGAARHQYFHADATAATDEERALVYLTDVLSEDGGALELEAGGVVLGPRGTAALYDARDSHRGRAVGAAEPARRALALAFGDSERELTTVGFVFTQVGTVVTSDYIQWAIDGNILGAFDAATLEVEVSGYAAQFLGTGDIDFVVHDAGALSYDPESGIYTWSDIIIGRTWPEGLRSITLPLSPYDTAVIPVTLTTWSTEAKSYAPYSLAFPAAAGQYDALVFARSGNHLHIYLHDNEAAALDYSDLSANTISVYSSAADGGSLGGTWFSGAGGMCVDGDALVGMADGSTKTARDVRPGDVVAAIDTLRYSAALLALGPAPSHDALVAARAASAIAGGSAVQKRSLTRGALAATLGEVRADRNKVLPWIVPQGVHGATADTLVSHNHGLVVASADAQRPLTAASQLAGTRVATAAEAARVVVGGLATLYNLALASDGHAMVVNGIVVEGARNWPAHAAA